MLYKHQNHDLFIYKSGHASEFYIKITILRRQMTVGLYENHVNGLGLNDFQIVAVVVVFRGCPKRAVKGVLIMRITFEDEDLI